MEKNFSENNQQIDDDDGWTLKAQHFSKHSGRLWTERTNKKTKCTTKSRKIQLKIIDWTDTQWLCVTLRRAFIMVCSVAPSSSALNKLNGFHRPESVCVDIKNREEKKKLSHTHTDEPRTNRAKEEVKKKKKNWKFETEQIEVEWNVNDERKKNTAKKK